MIDREKVIRHIIAEISIAKTCKKDFASVDVDMLSDALALLKEQKIVRCKDCNYYMKDGAGVGCDFCSREGFTTEPEDFCSRAERRKTND